MHQIDKYILELHSERTMWQLCLETEQCNHTLYVYTMNQIAKNLKTILFFV